MSGPSRFERGGPVEGNTFRKSKWTWEPRVVNGPREGMKDRKGGNETKTL